MTACKLKKYPLARKAIREEQTRLQFVLNLNTDKTVWALLMSCHKASTGSEEVRALRGIGMVLGLYALVS